MTKALSTIITDANGGMHSPVNYRKAMNMLKTHPYSIGLLYHIVLTAKKGRVVEDRKVYRKAVELLCKQLRTKGMPCRYKACYERDRKKRFHKHMFILIEAKDVHPDSIIHYKQGDWLTEMLSSLGLEFKIAEPRNPSKLHYVAGKQVNYAYVPKKASPKLDDCLVWISYLYKARSKDGVEGQIYTGSTNREPKRLVSDSPSAALPAAKEEAPVAEATSASKPIYWANTHQLTSDSKEVTSASIEAPVAQPIRIDRVFPRLPCSLQGGEAVTLVQERVPGSAGTKGFLVYTKQSPLLPVGSRPCRE